MPVTIQQISAKIKNESYLVLQDGRTTLCTITLENGYTVHGTSACVEAADFDMDIGRFHAFNKAMDQIWPLEGYLLAQFIYEQNPTTLKVEVKEEPTVVAKKPSYLEVLKGLQEEPPVVAKKKPGRVRKVLDKTLEVVAPFGYKKDGTPKKAPGRPRKEQEWQA